ncbi:MAG TPA: type 3 dihydrofolate reductase [Gammaproteobacteria bacterium]|nr:type 3 dihydrofolate reductase [Gammaproteobacteria bacterium]
MKISLIVAMDRKGVIGREGDLPWRLSSDLKHFKKITMGKPIIMGRMTHESIGRPLPGRENIVISRNKDYTANGCTVLNSLECVYAKFHDVDEIMIMGGEDLYRQTLDKADRIYLTEVHADLEGDTHFPEFDRESWEEVERYDFKKDEKNEYDYSFVILERPEDY